MIKSINFPGIDLAPHSEYKDYPVHLERLNWLYKTIQEQRAPGQTVRVLDVGCGTGNITVPLGMLPDSQIVGIDMHQPTLDIAIARNTHPNVKIEFSFLQDYDISSFDFIIFSEVLEHIPGYGALLEYIAQNAKPTMNMLVTIPTGWGPFEICMTPLYWMRKLKLHGFINRVKKLLGKHEPYSINYDTPHVNFFTQRQLRGDCERYGFEIKEFTKAFVFAPIIETYLPFVSLKWFAYYDNKLAQALPRGMTSGWYINFKLRT